MARPPVDANRKGLSLWMSGNSKRSKPVRGALLPSRQKKRGEEKEKRRQGGRPEGGSRADVPRQINQHGGFSTTSLPRGDCPKNLASVPTSAYRCTTGQDV